MPDNLGGAGNTDSARRPRRRRVDPETFGAVESSVLLPKRPTPGSPRFGGIERPEGQLTGETLKQKKKRLAQEAANRAARDAQRLDEGLPLVPRTPRIDLSR